MFEHIQKKIKLHNGNEITCDEGIADFVYRLNELGFVTHWSCQGHSSEEIDQMGPENQLFQSPYVVGHFESDKLKTAMMQIASLSSQVGFYHHSILFEFSYWDGRERYKIHSTVSNTFNEFVKDFETLLNLVRQHGDWLCRSENYMSAEWLKIMQGAKS